MVSICFYFQVHQPFRLRKYGIFNIGNFHNYFDDKGNMEVLQKVAKKCYLPTTKLLKKLIEKHPEFKISFSLSGVVIEQFKKWAPEVLESFKDLAKTGNVEFISETYYHSLSSVYSNNEFKLQVEKHKKLIEKEFGVIPKVFRNTELIYSNKLGEQIRELGFMGAMAEGADKILGWRSPNFIYNPPRSDLKLLLKNYRLSDDIAFRFSNKDWKEYPLTIKKFTTWVDKINGNGEIINLFMDFETFGEHQWEHTGIFKFLENLPASILKHPDNDFITPSEAIEKIDSKGEFDCPKIISWADVERDLTAWVGNDIQKSAVKSLYDLEKGILETKDDQLIEDWRKMQTSDHFYYMCTKWFNDGDVHKYFNPYENPYDAFINFMNIINDIILRVEKITKKKIKGFEEIKIRGVK